MQILLAESNLEAMRLLREALKVLGHEVVGQANSGSELIEFARTLRPDLIITEVLLSGANGLDAANQVYEERPIPIIVLSAYREREIVERGFDSHVMDFLLKPIGIAELDIAIIMAVKRHEQIQELTSEITELSTKLEEQKLISRAKGILMDKGHMTEAAAHRKLQQLSKERNIKMGLLARHIITATEALNGST